MDNIHSEHRVPLEILSEYCGRNKKFENRFIAMSNDINKYIADSGIDGKVFFNELILGYALIDYFEDIRRLKVFHKVEHINAIKVVSYTSYWLLRRKPIQVVAADKDVIYINELFVMAYILDFISSEENGFILDRDSTGVRSFAESLLYFLKYRVVTAQSIEMVILSFFGGQIYQETEKDLSSILGNKYSSMDNDE